MKRLVAIASVALLAVAAAVPATGQDTGYTPRETPTKLSGNVDLGAVTDLDQEVDAFVRLDEKPVAEVVADSNGRASKADQQRQAQVVLEQQAQLKDQVSGEEIYSLQVGANGVAMRATVREFLEVADRDDILSVTRLPVHTIDNSTSVPFIGAAQVWQDLGYTGEGLTIGVIDTGIDYLHADFGGPGTVEAFDSNDPTTLSDGGFTAKVAGGYDFVGDDYDASDPALATPQPDDDPLDCNGHGTHVAGTAAGQGVLADGSAYTGPYDATTEANEFEVGPGVAPEATLYALKVFGCDGSTNVVVEAIEWALDPNGDGSMDDHLDVINMSLGSDFGQPTDPDAIATDNAMDAGMLVVSAAGNDGPIPYVQGSPSSARKDIAVAASVDDGIVAGAIEVLSPESIAGQYETAEAAFTPPLVEVGEVDGELVPADDIEACASLANADEIEGNIALIMRGTCNFVDKVANAQDAGAIGVVVINNVDGPPIVMGGDPGDFTIPAVMVTNEDGMLMLETAQSGETVVVRMSGDFEIPKPELADTLADFTSAGPRGGDAFGPDLAAPGFSIDSAAVGTGSEGVLNSGTSMATPHVAGLAALMRQAHPDAATGDIKSLLMNSTVETNGSYPTTLMGTGVVRADRALDTDAFTSPAGVSFGRLNPVKAKTITRTITVTDLSGDARTYDIALSPIQEVAGVTVSAPSSVSVDAGGTATFDLTLQLDPAAMPADDGLYSETEVDGIVTLTSPDRELRVGYMAVVDPASNVVAKTARTGPRNEVRFINHGDTLGWVDTFTHISRGTGSLEEIGMRSLDDLTTLDIGVVSGTAWDSLSRRSLEIYIDVDRDRVDDYVLVAADLGYLQGTGATGQVATALFDLEAGTGLLEYLVIADLNDRTQILPVDLFGEYGFLEEGDNTFDYFAVDYDYDVPIGTAEGRVNLQRDVARPQNLSGSLDAHSQTVVTIVGAQRSRMLILYPNNQVPDQYESVRLGRR